MSVLPMMFNFSSGLVMAVPDSKNFSGPLSKVHRLAELNWPLSPSGMITSDESWIFFFRLDGVHVVAMSIQPQGAVVRIMLSSSITSVRSGERRSLPRAPLIQSKSLQKNWHRRIIPRLMFLVRWNRSLSICISHCRFDRLLCHRTTSHSGGN